MSDVGLALREANARIRALEKQVRDLKEKIENILDDERANGERE